MTESLKNKAINGATWKTIERLFRQIIQFTIGIVLARMLSPSDYGIIGMLTIFFALATTFQDSGFGSALIQKKNRTNEDYSTVFFFNVGASWIIYAILFFAAPYIADFYKTPILTDVTRVSAITFIINGLTGVQLAKLNIELKFKTISIVSILGQIITGIVGVTFAYYGWGVWALVYQGIISSCVMGFVIWICSGWHPSLVFSQNSFKSLFKFGGNMMLSNIINQIYNNIYTIVIGKVFNPTLVGMYNRANAYAHLPSNTVMDMALTVNFPILATIQDDNERLLHAYKKLLRVPFFILYPILTAIIVMATPLIHCMIGDKWLPCVPMLQILCVSYMFVPLNAVNLNLLYVKGRSDLSLRLEFIKKPLGIMILIASIPLGINWMIAGRALYSMLVYCLNCYYTKKILNYGILDQIKILLPIYINIIISGTVTFLFIACFDINVIKLLLGSTIFALIYLSIAYIKKDESLQDIIEIVKNKFLKTGKRHGI